MDADIENIALTVHPTLSETLNFACEVPKALAQISARQSSYPIVDLRVMETGSVYRPSTTRRKKNLKASHRLNRD